MMTSLGNDVLRARLQSGAEVLASGLDAAQIDRLMDFLALLQKWNRVYNLRRCRIRRKCSRSICSTVWRRWLRCAAIWPTWPTWLIRPVLPFLPGPGRASALARCGFGRWPAWRGVCHLLPAVGCALRRQRGQEGRFHWAGGVAAQ